MLQVKVHLPAKPHWNIPNFFNQFPEGKQMGDESTGFSNPSVWDLNFAIYLEGHSYQKWTEHNFILRPLLESSTFAGLQGHRCTFITLFHLYWVGFKWIQLTDVDAQIRRRRNKTCRDGGWREEWETRMYNFLREKDCFLGDTSGVPRCNENTIFSEAIRWKTWENYKWRHILYSHDGYWDKYSDDSTRNKDFNFQKVKRRWGIISIKCMAKVSCQSKWYRLKSACRPKW